MMEMKRSWLVVVALPFAIAGCMESSRMSRTSDVVTERPTISSIGGRQSVLYDDGRCPAGEVAQFTRRGGQAQLVRRCVIRPG